MLSLALFSGSTAFAATTYYVQLGTSGAATWDASYASTGTIVDLSTANKGSAATFNAWFADKSLNTPTFALPKLTSGDKVWIAAGTYYLTGTVTLKAGVSIYGGFAGTVGETVANRAKNSTDKWDFSNITALDGSVGGVKTYIAITGGDAVLTTLVDGLTIQNCNNGSTNTSGGAGKITGAATTMQNCIITACTLATGSTAGTGASAGITLTAAGSLKDSYIHHNTASTNYGGGITVSGSLCTVSGCKIEYNTTTGDGGGIYLYSYASGVNISNCSFSYNSANLAGGAIATYVANAPASPIGISTCTFTGNNAKGSGGAMNLSVTGATFNISGCTFTSNYSTVSSSAGAGGGALILSTSAFSIDKCTFTGNYTTLSSGGAITIPSTASCTISNSKFLANTAGSTTTSSGSAIYSKSNYTANNCLFADNTGITPITFYTSAAASTYQNCTFANNLSSTGTAAPIVLLNIGTSPYPPYIFSNCLFYNVSGFSGQTNPTTTNCASDRTLSNISIKTITAADFVDAANATVASRDYRLSATSLALNAGTTIAACSPDIAGVIRQQGSAYDIGAYELPYFNTTITFNANGAINSYSTGDVDAKPQGTQLTYTITPSTGYQLTSIKYNGTDVTSSLVGNVFTAPALSANATLVVQFDLINYNTTITFNSNGTVNSYTTGDVDTKPYGTQLAFTITPNSGYVITSVLYNGTEVKGDIVSGVYTAPAIVANATLVVQFDLATGLTKTQSAFQCYSVNNSIELRNVTIGEEMTVYAMTGSKIKSGKISTSNISIAVPRGIYMVKVGSNVQKVAVQ